MLKYINNVLIGFDQFINTLLFGEPDETISSRCWRNKDKSKFWSISRKLVDNLFFYTEDHCYKSYVAEVERQQITWLKNKDKVV